MGRSMQPRGTGRETLGTRLLAWHSASWSMAVLGHAQTIVFSSQLKKKFFAVKKKFIYTISIKENFKYLETKVKFKKK